MKRIIAITGLDGVGKNSVIDRLLTLYPGSVSAEIWQPMYGDNSPFSSKQAVDNYLCSLSGEARSLFLAHALMESTGHAQQSSAEIVFLNAYYFKYFSSELALGVSPAYIQQLIALFPVPEITIELTCPVETTANRKQRFSRYECGLATNPSKESFVEFQQKCNQHMDRFRADFTAEFPNTASIEELIASIQRIISR